MKQDKRRHPRTGSHNLVSYVCLDEGAHVKSEGIGRTLNVSEGGILLETREPFDPSCTITLMIALEDELMELKGRVAYAKERAGGRHETGIQFIDSEEKKMRLLRQFITICGSDSEAPP
jgi:hypothetical protein